MRISAPYVSMGERNANIPLRTESLQTVRAGIDRRSGSVPEVVVHAHRARYLVECPGPLNMSR